MEVTTRMGPAFGVARMFEAYREHPDFKIRVFRRLGDAEQWLGVGDPA